MVNQYCWDAFFIYLIKVQRCIRKLCSVFLHYGPGGKGIQWAIPWGQPRDSTVVHLQPSGPRASAWNGEYKSAALCWRTCRHIHNSNQQHVMSAAWASFIHSCLLISHILNLDWWSTLKQICRGWRHSPPHFLNTILIKCLLLSFPGRLIAGESLKKI